MPGPRHLQGHCSYSFAGTVAFAWASALVYLFGNQGIFKSSLMGHEIYGPIGIVLGEVFFAFPHALMILVTALSVADAPAL